MKRLSSFLGLVVREYRTSSKRHPIDHRPPFLLASSSVWGLPAKVRLGLEGMASQYHDGDFPDAALEYSKVGLLRSSCKAHLVRRIRGSRRSMTHSNPQMMMLTLTLASTLHNSISPSLVRLGVTVVAGCPDQLWPANLR